MSLTSVERPVANPFSIVASFSRFRCCEQIIFAAQAAETVVAILSLLEEGRAKMDGNRLADVPISRYR